MTIQHAEQAEQVKRGNISAFMRQASLIQTNKIHFKKEYIKKYKVLDKAYGLAEQYLGKEINFLQDRGKISQYIEDLFGVGLKRLFKDGVGGFGTGEYNFGIEHALLLYYKLTSENHDLTDKAKGLLYFLAGHQLDDEFTQIGKVAPKNTITPIFEMSSTLFRWKRCNHILRKYMLFLSQVEGYRGYYYEKPLLGQIAYLTTQGKSFDEAEAELKTMSGGLLHTFLPLHLENYLLPTSMTGMFFEGEMDGSFKATYLRDSDKVKEGTSIDASYNVYNSIIKPVMIELNGMIIKHITEAFTENPDLNPKDAYIYHVSPHRVGILVKEDIEISDILPVLSPSLKLVEEFNFEEGVLTGEFL